MHYEEKTIPQLIEELREFFTTNAQGKQESFATMEIDKFVWNEQHRRRIYISERAREGYNILLPKTLAHMSDKIKGIIEKWPNPYASYHEGLGVLLEEVDELSKEVFKKETAQSADLIYKEASDVAAVALRIMIECTPDTGPGRVSQNYFNK